jgi:type I restriction enzyme S subunit
MSDVLDGFREMPLGLLPETWDVVSLGEVITQRREAVNPRDVPELVYVGLEHLDTGDPNLKRWGDASQVRSAKSRFYPGDTLYGKLRPYLDKAVLTEARGICSTDILVLTAREGLDSAFLPYLMHTRVVLNHAIATTTGVNHPRTSWRALSRLGVGLPPLPEQRAIARVLRTVQRAREATDGVIAAVRELKRSLVRHLFTYGPVPVGEAERVELQDTEIGPIPAHWSVVELEGLLRERLRNGRSARVSNVGVRALTLTAVTRNDFSIRNTKLTEADPDSVEDLWLEPGDILIERANTRELVGLAALYDGPRDFAIFPDLMVRVRPKEDLVHPKFLTEFLLSPVSREYFRRNARGTAGNMPKIDHGTIGRIHVALPVLAEQREIARILSTVDAKIAAEEARQEALDGLFHSLLHHLMTGRIRTQEFQRQDAKPPSREEENLGDFAS